MFSLFCGPSKSRGRRKKRNSDSFTSQCSAPSSDGSSCYHSPYRGGSHGYTNKAKNGGFSSSRSVMNTPLSSRSTLDLNRFVSDANPSSVVNTPLSSRSTLDLNSNHLRTVFRSNSNFSSNVCSDEYDDIGSTSNLSVIDRINKLTGNNRSNSRFRRRPKSMMTSSFKNPTNSAAAEKSPLKRAHSARFKAGATIHEDKMFEEEEEEDEEGESTFNIFDKLLLLDFNNKNNYNNNLGAETKCKLRRTRSGVSSRSSATRRSLGSTTNLSAVEKLCVSLQGSTTYSSVRLLVSLVSLKFTKCFKKIPCSLFLRPP